LPQTRFTNCYGPTETILYTSYHIFDRPLNPEVNIFPIGFPIANNKFILDRTGLSDPQKGELIIVGPQVGAGYWNDPERTRNAFGVTDKGERYYRTGDIASFNPKVGYFIHGRKDHQIKFMGYRIELGEIEHVLTLLPSVKENVVIPVYGKDKIEELRLIYSGDGDCDNEIRKHLNKHLPSYMIPKSLIRVESLPKNQNNKIDRVVIKEMYGVK
jgi:D-alanine--poly(phosphoribitol) ligase subunit 1